MDSANAVVDALRRAIQGESDGYHFYKMAAANTADPKGKEMFEILASEELSHMEFLKSQYGAILRTGRVDPEVKLGPRKEFGSASPIFSEALLERIKDAHVEMSALSIGMQLELNSINLYRKEAEQASDPYLRAFYSELAEWESGHYQALFKQHELLKKDYWAAAGFAPF